MWSHTGFKHSTHSAHSVWEEQKGGAWDWRAAVSWSSRQIWGHQVLCRESLTGRCYWETEWSGAGVNISVVYKGISRKGQSDDSWFGYNEKSWSLNCSYNRFASWHNYMSRNISVPLRHANRVGVYLDWSAGTLSFYNISDTHTLTHLHTFNTTFTEPLYAGFRFYYSDTSVSLWD